MENHLLVRMVQMPGLKGNDLPADLAHHQTVPLRCQQNQKNTWYVMLALALTMDIHFENCLYR